MMEEAALAALPLCSCQHNVCTCGVVPAARRAIFAELRAARRRREARVQAARADRLAAGERGDDDA